MFRPFKLLRAFVFICLAYFGWLGIAVLATPWVTYMHLRDQGATRWQAYFLAFCSIWVMGFLIDLIISGLPH